MKNKVLAILILCVVAYVALTPGMMKTVTSALAHASQASQSLTNSIAPLSSTNSPYTVVGQPTLTAGQIDTILRSAHSPAYGTGNAMYAEGVQYGIDPIFALAFFRHESSFGVNGWALPNKSLGNIRCSSGYVCRGGYRSYTSWQASYADWYQLIANLYIKQLHLVTVEQIVRTYAPSSENNTQAYINSVESSVSAWRGTK